MLYYPQLSTGALVQLPFRRLIRRPAIINALPGGVVIKAADTDANTIEWRLSYTGLTDSEQSALQSFFLAAEGRLRSFTFLDPATNLLQWSDALNNDAWRRDAMLQLTGLAEGISRIVNAGQTEQGIQQTVGAPSWYQYSFSAYVRGEDASVLRMRVISPEGEVCTEAQASGQWQRIVCSGSAPGRGGAITCRVDTSAGSVVEIRGLQLDAQSMPSEYRRTTSKSGVHSCTRFVDDRLVFTTNGIDDHSTTIRLVTRAEA